MASDIGAFANPFGSPSSGEWNLSRGAYINGSAQEVVFFFEVPNGEDPTQKTALETANDSGGRRLVKYEYPYLDGQRVRDLGRKAESFTMNIKFWGLNYQQRFNEFISVALGSSKQGTLLHPLRGSITARFETYEFVHRYDEWNAVTIKATFVEAALDADLQTQTYTPSADSALRSALQSLTTIQASISNGIAEVSALLLLPGSIISAMQSRLTSLTGQTSRLLGQLGVTFSSDATTQQLAQAAAPLSGGITDLTSGTVATPSAGGTTLASLPPVYQVGLDPTAQDIFTTQLAAFVNANQVSTQQAVYNANAARVAIAAAIDEINTNFGNDGYDLVVQYRLLANQIQAATEASISSEKSLVTIYTTPTLMSLRQIAFANNLSIDSQNDIEALNPNLASVNYIPAGTQITVPVSA